MLLGTLIFLGFGIAGSFCFAGVETGFLSWNPMKVRHFVKKHRGFYDFLPGLLKDKERVLATVLIGNNLSIVAASLFFERLVFVIDQDFYSGFALLPSLDLLILTPFMILFTEMLPKSLFRIYSFRLTIKAVPFLTLFYWLFYPLTSVIVFIFGTRNRVGKTLNCERRIEIALMAKEGVRQGNIVESAETLMRNILELKNVSVSHSDFCFNPQKIKINKRLTVNDKVSDFLKKGKGKKWDFYPVFDKSKKSVIGYVPVEKVLTKGRSGKIENIMTEFTEESEIKGKRNLVSFISEGLGFLHRFYIIRGRNRELIVSSQRIHNSIIVGS